tara:strand:+ start:672 stop:2384 length:1713 start_codon:yes stop_codon:yes gene_type:complete
MTFKFNKITIFIIFFFILFSNTKSFSSNESSFYSKENVTNYIYGMLSSKNNNYNKSLDSFEKIRKLEKIHTPFIKHFIFSLVENQKINQAFFFLKKNREKSEFFEGNIILGSIFLVNNEFKEAKKEFNIAKNQQQISNFEILIANTLIYYSHIVDINKIEKDNINANFFKGYGNFNKIQEVFINCYLDNENVDTSFQKLINSKEINYNRYIYFYINYLYSKKRYNDAKNIIDANIDNFNSNILLDQTKKWIDNNQIDKIKNLFNCKNPKHLISEFFYLIANLYAAENSYSKSNFYLNLSNYLNPKFKFNKILLADNFFKMGNYYESRNLYEEFKIKDTFLNWYSVKQISKIESVLGNNDLALDLVIDSYKQIPNPSIKIVFDMANFYKNSKKYNKAINLYSQLLDSLNEDHELYKEILYRRGGSYERLKMWKESDSDLIKSLEIEYDDPYVLNYLAYSWLERNFNKDKAMEMLMTAYELKPRDPYILDSVGWAYYLNGDYNKAEKFIRIALEIMPQDPTVNDHYGDILWKLNKSLEARYFWKNVINLKDADTEIKKKIKKKLVFGVESIS